MGTSFSINLDDVGRVASLMGQTANELTGSSTLGDGPYCLADSDPMASEFDQHVSSFFHDWSDGMSRISAHLTDIAGALEKAVAAYSNTEDEIITAASPTK